VTDNALRESSAKENWKKSHFGPGFNKTSCPTQLGFIGTMFDILLRPRLPTTTKKLGCIAAVDFLNYIF